MSCHVCYTMDSGRQQLLHRQAIVTNDEKIPHLYSRGMEPSHCRKVQCKKTVASATCVTVLWQQGIASIMQTQRHVAVSRKKCRSYTIVIFSDKKITRSLTSPGVNSALLDLMTIMPLSIATEAHNLHGCHNHDPKERCDKAAPPYRSSAVRMGPSSGELNQRQHAFCRAGRRWQWDREIKLFQLFSRLVGRCCSIISDVTVNANVVGRGYAFFCR